MKRRTLITVALLGAALTVGLVLCLCARLDNSHFSVTSTGPLDIRLWGIRPDASDAIYDPDGRKIAETLGNARRDKAVWGDNNQRHDFIFDIPDTNEPITFLPFRYLVDGEERQGGNFVESSLYFAHKGRNLGWFQTIIPRTIRKSLVFGLWKKDVAIDRIDLSLQYYYCCRPPRNPICTFKGPFEAGRKVTDETGLYEISFVPPRSTSPRKLIMRFCPRRRIDPIGDALFYDAEGKRHHVGSGWSFTVPSGKEVGYFLPRMPLKNIAMITIGEEPFGITVRNLKLPSPDSEHRTYAEHLDRMAERLDHELDPIRYQDALHKFTDINKLLKVIDLLRGKQIHRAYQNLCSLHVGTLGAYPAALNTEQTQRLRQTVLRWANAMDPEIRMDAVRLGLYYRWPEFYDVAFDLLEYPGRDYFRADRVGDYFHVDPVRCAAVALCSQREHISERHVERIAELLLRRTHPDGFACYLLDCLHHPKSPARVKALWDLANCEQPRLWTYAIRRLSMWGEFDGKHDSLPEKLKPRVFLMIGPHGFSDPSQIAPDASALLLNLLSGRLLIHDGMTYESLLERVPESIDRRAVTAVMIESLRNMEYHRDWSIWGAISRVVKYLNLWHGLDMGGLGSDVRKQTPDLDKMDLEAVAAEAVEWYDTVYQSADPNAAR